MLDSYEFFKEKKDGEFGHAWETYTTTETTNPPKGSKEEEGGPDEPKSGRTWETETGTHTNPPKGSKEMEGEPDDPKTMSPVKKQPLASGPFSVWPPGRSSS